jgi:L-threonylcarbamoyladenylate synthase
LGIAIKPSYIPSPMPTATDIPPADDAAANVPQHTVPVVPAGPAALERAAAALADGRLVAFPTETVYGLGGDARNALAVAAIFAAKGRPSFNPLIVHVGDLDSVDRYAVLDARAYDLAARYWPGPLTLVLPRRPGGAIADLATAGLDTVAIRIPAHPVARALLKAFGGPVAAPSANPSGRISPTTPAHVVEGLGRASELALILAGGRAEIGLESTVLDLSRPGVATLLRPGAVTGPELEQLLGEVGVSTGQPDQPRSPGQLLRHYAPGVPVRLNATRVEPDEAWLGFGPDPFSGRGARTQRNLSEQGNLLEAAANLFSMLRQLDRPEHRGIAVAAIPETGLGVAINDRLRRAATA